MWLEFDELEHPPRAPLNVRCTHIKLESMSDGEVRALLVLLYLQVRISRYRVETYKRNVQNVCDR